MIKLTDNLEINKPAPADDRLGVFASVAEANQYIHIDRRFLGLKVLIDNAGTAEEYWYQDGITDGDLVAYSAGGGGGGTTWGSITGTLSNQIDLQTELDSKVPYSGADQDVNLGEHGISAGFFQADLTPTEAPAVGRMLWNDTDGTMNLGLKGGNVTLQIGQKEIARVVNGTGGNLLASNYQAVRITGAQGQRLQVLLAQANNDINSATTIGLVAENINNNQQGFITTGGQITGLNTSGSLQGENWDDGDILYLSPTTAGALTNVKPVAPSHSIVIGWVEYAHQNNGKIFVKVDNGYEINELHNVDAQNPNNRDGLFFNTSTQLWESRAIASDDLPSLDASKITSGTFANQRMAKVSRPVIRIVTPSTAGNSTSEINITSITIPANSLIAGDIIRIGAFFSFLSNTGTKTPRIRLGLNSTAGNPLYSPSAISASVTNNQVEVLAIVTSSTNLRIVPSSTISGLGTGTGALTNNTIDLSQPISFSFNIQKSVGADTAILEFAWIEILTS